MTFEAREAEMRLLGGAMISVNWVNAIFDQLSIDHFTCPQNRLIWATMRDLYHRNEYIDTDRLIALGRKEGMNLDHLIDVSQMGNTAFDKDDLIAEVKDAFQKRTLLLLSQFLVEKINTKETAANIQREFENKLFESTEQQSKKTITTAKDILTNPSMIEEIKKRNENYLKGILPFLGHSTGFYDIDRYIKGLMPSRVYVIAGRPGIGKTVLSLNLIQNLCMNRSLKVLMFSLEMNSTDLMDKLICSSANVDYDKFVTGNVGLEELKKLEICIKVWENKTVIIDEQGSLPIDQMRARAVRAKRAFDIDVIIIDYMQLLTSPGNATRELEVADISRKIKSLAKELNVPIVCLAQLNRDSDKREGKRPAMSDLRESGQIEQDADAIMLLHREEIPNKATEMKVIFAKNRFGNRGDVTLVFDGAKGRYENYSKDEYKKPEGPDPFQGRWK